MYKSLFKRALLGAFLAVAVSSCHTPTDITYFQNLNAGESVSVSPIKEITALPDDRLQIYVHTRTSELAQPFNLGVRTQGASNTAGDPKMYYVVDSFGNIEFPVIGSIHVGGLTRHQIAELIKNELINRNLLKDPTVVVAFTDHAITVLGDVARPGKFEFEKDRITVLEAIAMAGDLTITGERLNVKVIRQEEGRERAYVMDLCDANSVYSSPAFYLQQNDLIYVEPDDFKKRTATANGNSWLTPSFWLGIASFAVSMTLIFVKI